MTTEVIEKTTHWGVALLRSPAMWLGVGLGAVELANPSPFDPSGGMTLALPLLALAYLVFAAVRHRPARPGVLRLQAAGVVAFTALALAALVVDPALGRYVVAAGWLAHAGWDLAHRDGSVAPTWYVRFCIPFDLLIAASLVVGGSA